MCGINGIVQLDASAAVNALPRLERMNAAMAHRGPDDEGIWIEGAVAIGHRRLSIIDLSTAGHQPMFSADGRFVLVFNGEIYNFQALRAELPHYPYQSGTDSEVLLAAYSAWGAECLNRFYGMFAFAIWDREREELFLARDRMGVKPLYLSFIAGVLAFSSEIRALMASGVPTFKLSEASVVDYLRYQTVHAPYTILEDVQMLLPAHYAYWR
jgi:asparagine synthase (glutamine-hydrolysing)